MNAAPNTYLIMNGAYVRCRIGQPLHKSVIAGKRPVDEESNEVMIMPLPPLRSHWFVAIGCNSEFKVIGFIVSILQFLNLNSSTKNYAKHVGPLGHQLNRRSYISSSLRFLHKRMSSTCALFCSQYQQDFGAIISNFVFI